MVSEQQMRLSVGCLHLRPVKVHWSNGGAACLHLSDSLWTGQGLTGSMWDQDEDTLLNKADEQRARQRGKANCIYKAGFFKQNEGGILIASLG